jgi:hypothetical protein
VVFLPLEGFPRSLVSKRIELVLRHAVANRSEETERILQRPEGFGHRCQPTGAQDRTRAGVWIFLPVGGFYHKQLECRNETNFVATARSSDIVPKGPS